jgi:hypothetical protein
MIVYGDPARCEHVQHLIAQLRDECDSLGNAINCNNQSDDATSILISSGELWQGLVDEEYRLLEFDEWTPLAEHCARLTMAAAALAADRVASEPVETLLVELDWLAAADLPNRVTIKSPEGYAFYAVYPQLYAMAAKSLERGHNEPVTVIGLRSIGTSLAAVVAHAARARELPVTVRPCGHPFQRRINVGLLLEDRILKNRDGRYAIVDEGPGLSGSSFLSVADWLLARGVREEQLNFFPSHDNELGSAATPAHLEFWRRVRRHTVSFGGIESDVLSRLSSELPIEISGESWEDVSAGRWRQNLLASGSQWPPAHVQQERRKYLLQANETIWLAKYAGLGRYGQYALERGIALGNAGLSPLVHQLRDGFLIGSWLSDARPLLEPGSLNSADRAALLEFVARYLEFRAEHFPTRSPGANTAQLWKMAQFNMASRFGAEQTSDWAKWEGRLQHIAENVRPVETDNKMQAWEWLALSNGEWAKADALDHHADHQCIGSQDISWDIAGAICELELDQAEAEDFKDRLAHRGFVRRNEETETFYEVCYLAFQMGYCTLGTTSLGPNSEESARFKDRADLYARRLENAISKGQPANPAAG